jgi:hypothetical protein
VASERRSGSVISGAMAIFFCAWHSGVDAFQASVKNGRKYRRFLAKSSSSEFF